MPPRLMSMLLGRLTDFLSFEPTHSSSSSQASEGLQVCCME